MQLHTNDAPGYPDFGPWRSVEDAMPEPRFRVWASSGPTDVGHDCFYGGRSSILEDQSAQWRRTDTEDPVPHPITHWRALPAPPAAGNPDRIADAFRQGILHIARRYGAVAEDHFAGSDVRLYCEMEQAEQSDQDIHAILATAAQA